MQGWVSTLAEYASIAWWSFYSWLKEWQTLVAGLLAIIGAYATLRGVDRQIDYLREVDNKRRERELFAARAALPFTLSAIGNYAQGCILLLRQVRRTAEVEDRRSLLQTLSGPPDSAVHEIKAAILAVDKGEANELASLISWFQVHESRLKSLTVGPHDRGAARVRWTDVDLAMADAALLYARSTRLLPWARRDPERDQLGDVWKEAGSALFLAGVHKEEFPDAYQMIAVNERASKRLDP